MSPTVSAAPNTESSANERAIPIMPERSDAHVVYLPPESRYVSYEIAPAPSFDLGIRRTERGYWIVWDEPTGIFGEGDEPLEAIRDFQRAVIGHLEILEEESDTLPDGQLWQLGYLRARIQR